MTVLSTIVLALAVCLAPQAQQATPAKDKGPGHRFGRETPLPRKKGDIRVASYNLLNLFDQVDDPKLSGNYDDLPMATNDDRCKGLARAIKSLDADILCVQEIESEEALTWFRDTYLKGLGYDHVAARDVGYYRGVEQGVLSRFPITAVKTWPEEDLTDMQARKDGEGWADCKDPQGQSFQRSPIMVDVKVPASRGRKAYELAVVVIHHKSGYDYNCQRESEALQIIDLINQRIEDEPELNLIALGDFNGSPGAKSVKAYQDAGFKNAYEYRWQPEEYRRELFRTHESDRCIDFIMLHPNAWKEARKGSFQVVGTLHPGDKYNWRTDDPPAGYAADHYPLSIDLVPVEK